MPAVAWPSVPLSSSHPSYQSTDDTSDQSDEDSINQSNPYGDCSGNDPIFHSSRVTFLNWSRTHPEDLYYWALRLPWIRSPVSYLSVSATIMFVIVLTVTSLSWIDAGNINLNNQSNPASNPIHPTFKALLLYYFLVFTGGPTVTSWSMNSGYLTAIMSLTSLTRVAYFTIVTALLYARFARPISRIRFSSNVVIGMHRDSPSLMIRLANDRLDALFNTEIKLTLSYNGFRNSEPSDHSINQSVSQSSNQSINQSAHSSNDRWRVYQDLKLTRSGLPLFLLPWTVSHVIDSDSPLYNHDLASLKAAQAELHVTISATDLVFAGTIHARKTYLAQSFRFYARFADVITFTDDDHRIVNMENMDKVVDLRHHKTNDEEKQQADEQTLLIVDS